MSAILRGVIAGFLLALVAANTGVGHTANLTMAAPANLKTTSYTINAASLAPAGCAAIPAGLTRVAVANAASFNAGNTADLVLGRNAVTTLNGQNGNDCIIGGQNADTLNGGANTDVCIGGPGADSFNASCETQVQ